MHLHLCRYGYKSIWEVEEVVANYSAAGLPLDTIWTDIDYMHAYRDFTFDDENWPTKRVQVGSKLWAEKGTVWECMLVRADRGRGRAARGKAYVCSDLVKLSVPTGNLAAALWHPVAPTQRLLPARLRP